MTRTGSGPPIETVLTEIALLTESNYPYIYIASHEEQRVREAAMLMGSNLERKVFVWSSSAGLHSADQTPRPLGQPQTLSDGLEDIERFRGAAIFVVYDADHQLQSYEVCRRMKDMAASLERESKSVYLVGTKDKVPVVLSKDVSTVHFPLPDLNELLETLDEASRGKVPDDHRELIARSALGLTDREARRAFRKAMVQDGRLDYEDVERVVREKQRIVGQSGAVTFHSSSENIQSVGGLENLKRWIKQRARVFSKDAIDFGLPPPKGMLLLGVQGCGKSLACKAVAAEWRMPLLRLDMGAVYGSYVGMSEENIRTAMKVAESVAPCVLWIDEIEKGISGMSLDSVDGGVSSRVFSSLLTWLQEKQNSVFVAATANRIECLPPELLRRGRFDEIFFVDLPNITERKEIFGIHIQKHGRKPETFDLDTLSDITEGHSGAEIEQAVINALYEAFAEGVELEDRHIKNAVEETVPLSRTMAEEIRELQRWAYDRARPAS